MISDFLQPVDQRIINDYYATNPYISDYIHLYHEKKSIEDYKVAILGVEDFRGFIQNKGVESAPNEIRKQLYQYAAFTNGIQLLDVGNIKPGDTYIDTLVAVIEVLRELFKQNIITIILGGDNALAMAQFRAYEIFENEITVSQIASKVLWEESDTDLHKTYLKDIFLSPILKKYNLLAYQSYMIQDKQLSFLNDKQHNVLRVGKIRENILESEPYLREANMVSINLNAIRYSDAPGQIDASPNGLFGDEACGLAKFSGMSDLLMSIGFFDYNPTFDKNEITAKQISQMIWYFMEGVSLRRNDYPIVDLKDFNTFIVQIEDAENDFTFLKSKKSDRWWMKIEYEKFGKKLYNLIPCTHKDYISAINNEIPERWMREWMRVN
jgi:formiminoglutamase